MKATKEITLDIALEHLPITVQAKQGDVNTRFIICNIANGLEKFRFHQIVLQCIHCANQMEHR